VRELPQSIVRCALLGLISGGITFLGEVSQAQVAFDPPPPPGITDSQVRGVQRSPESLRSPATFNPPAQTPIFQLEGDLEQDSAPQSSEMKPIEGGEILARIDGEIVLASDVLWQANLLIAANLGRVPPEELARIPPEHIEQTRRMLLRQQVMGLIDTKILYADFRRTVPAENLPKLEENLTEPFLEMEVPRLIEMLEVTDRRELEQLLGEVGTSLQDMKRQFVERTIAGEWLRQMAPKPKTVTHEQMLEYYQEHIEDYDFPAQVEWEELMIRFDRMNGDRKAAWEAICELGNQVWTAATKNPELRGPVFKGLAEQKSHGYTAHQGGYHEWTTFGALRSEEINSALFSLRVGQLSDIIESESGFHIVRVLKRKDSGRKPFTEAQTEIRKILENQQKGGLVEAEMAKLRNKSQIWTVFDGDISGEKLEALMQRRRDN